MPPATAGMNMSGLPCTIFAATTPVRATTLPTDRSMPPVRITKVWPIASNARTEASSRIVWPFETVANRGLSMVNMKTMRMSTRAMAFGARAVRILDTLKRPCEGPGSLPIEPTG